MPTRTVGRPSRGINNNSILTRNMANLKARRRTGLLSRTLATKLRHNISSSIRKDTSSLSSRRVISNLSNLSNPRNPRSRSILARKVTLLAPPLLLATIVDRLSTGLKTVLSLDVRCRSESLHPFFPT